MNREKIVNVLKETNHRLSWLKAVINKESTYLGRNTCLDYKEYLKRKLEMLLLLLEGCSMADEENLIWIDLETTGLNPNDDCILEIATIVTDKNLNIIAEGPNIVISQPYIYLENLHPWVEKQHTLTGLLAQVRESKISENEAESMTLEFIKSYTPIGTSPMAGNSVCFDRRFLYRYMPKLEKYFHYRNLDVSTIKELARRWQPKIYEALKKKSQHRAIDDVRESIEELRFYRDNFLLS